jgi:hypothetical protein
MIDENNINSPKILKFDWEKNPALIEPTEKLATEFLAMAEEFKAAGDNRYQSA